MCQQINSRVLFVILASFVWAKVDGKNEDVCLDMQLMIGLTTQGDAIIANFPSSAVGQVADSVERCSDSGLPLANVRCIKLRNWMVYDTFSLTTSPCNGSIEQHWNIFTTTYSASSFTYSVPEYTTQKHERLDNASKHTESLKRPMDLLNNLTIELENVTSNSSLSITTFSDFIKKTDDIVTSLPSKQATARSNNVESILEYQSAIVNTLDVLVSDVDLPKSGNLKITTTSFVVEIQDIELHKNGSTKESISFTDLHSSVSFDISKSSIEELANRNNQTRVRVGFVFHKNSCLFPSSSFRSNQVISASVYGVAEENDLLEPVSFKTSKSDIEFNSTSERLTCGYWDFQQRDWSEKGCDLLVESDTFNCRCTHLTNFAILVDLHRHDLETDISEKKDFENITFLSTRVITWISDIGCSLSIVGLIINILLQLSFASLRERKHQKVLFHLSLSLLAAYTVFLIGVRATKHFLTCALAAAFLHYFWLCAWCWMAVEGYTMYGLLVKVMDMRSVHKYAKKAALFAYGAPAVVVTLSAALSLFYLDLESWHHARSSNETLYTSSVKSDEKTMWSFNASGQKQQDWKSSYIGSDACWPWGPAYYFGFLMPVGLIFVFNLLSFGLVLHAITKTRNKIPLNLRKKRVRQQFANALTMTALLGLSWSFGFISMAITDPLFLGIMKALHALFNTTQGFFLFIVFSVRHRNVRATWTRALHNLLSCRYPKRQMSSCQSRPAVRDDRKSISKPQDSKSQTQSSDIRTTKDSNVVTSHHR